MSDPAPLIVTARLDPTSFALFDRLRRAHFPPARNHLAAHLTLFHHLPGEDLERLSAALDELARASSPMPFRAATVRLLGSGVAVAIACPPLVALRAVLAAVWASVLTPQDRAGLKPHVTVQNKASPDAARTLAPHIAALLPIEGRIEGLGLHRYRGGPWQDVGRFAFLGPSGLPVADTTA